jgi:hypothetical protein
MPTRKQATKTTKKAAKKGGKKGGKKSTGKSAASRAETGSVPPYGEAIRGAIARGDTREMKDLAASTRKWLDDVESALQELESNL